MTKDQESRATALMIRAQEGDALAYAELLTLLAIAARQYARNRLGAVAWLDDIVQETLLSIHSARQTYDPRRPLAPWFYAILSRRLIDVLRKEAPSCGSRWRWPSPPPDCGSLARVRTS